MIDLQDKVRVEVEDLHRFFVDWFGGIVEQQELARAFEPRLDDQFVIVSPDGKALRKSELLSMFARAHGSNPDFRIEIRDVTLLRETDDWVLASYTEWQRGARNSALSRNARISTLLLTRAEPFRWLHVHETWLPEAVVAGGSFEF